MTNVSTRTGGSKLAASVAERIVADVKDLGWPEDAVLGSEAELLERYGVSRAVFREAVRLVEHQQVARMRRGPGGGLVIAAPSSDSVVDAVAIYLLFAEANVEHVAQVRLALEDTVAELAPRRLTEEDIASLRELAARERDDTSADPRELHTLLASMTRNPALAFCVDLLNRLTSMYSPSLARIKPETLQESAGAHLAIIDAAIAGNEGLTVHRMHKHIEAELTYLHGRSSGKRLLDPSLLRTLEKSDKRGERLAREIFLEVREDGWPEGKLLGSEAELIDRFGVSRAVLREAVRLLEHHQIAAMRRGPGGGLLVTRPGVEATTGAITLLIERGGITPTHLSELRTALELITVELVVERLDEEDGEALHRALAVEESAVSAEEFNVIGHDLHDVLARMTGNPVLELLCVVVTRLTRMHQGVPSGGAQPSYEAVHRTHAAIVEAIEARDAGLARHRMRRHLEALMVFVQ
ncbi:MAG: FadR/GntR family transcriptional regulator [Acidimicrobiia bacterium]